MNENIQKRTLRSYSVRYALLQAFYWITLCAIISYLSVFLLDRGYTNSQIGLMLALSNIIAVGGQPLMANFVDRHRRFRLNRIVALCGCLMLVLAGMLVFMNAKSLLLSVTLLILMTFIVILQPLITSLSTYYETEGIRINFGASRAMGSLSYALTSAVLGSLVESRPTYILPLSGVFFIVALVILAITYERPKVLGEIVRNVKDQWEKEAEEPPSSLVQFIKGNKRFMVFLLGIIFLFYNHTLVSNFAMQIVDNIGGDSGDMGSAASVCAIAELPAMIFFNKLRKKFGCRNMIRVAVAAYIVKHVLIMTATTLPMYYAAQVFQMASYAIFLPASVYYTSQIIRRADAVKGQAMVTTAFTIASVFSSLTAGILMDAYGVDTAVVLGTAVSTVGCVILFFGAEKCE